MAEGDKISITITADASQAENVIKAFTQKATKAGDEVNKKLGGAASVDPSAMLGGWKTLFAGIAAAAAGLGLAKIFKDSVAAASESEKTVHAFNTALAMTGQFTEKASQSFQQYADGLAALTGVQDEAITSGATLLLNMGRVSTEALPRATRAALDLSSALGLGTEQAFTLVSKAASGNVEMLGRYGIKVSESIPKSERFAAALAQIEARFGGMAEGAGKTFEGSLNRLAVTWDNLLETLGGFVTKSPAVKVAIDFFSQSFDKLGKALESMAGGRDIFGDLLRQLAAFAVGFNTYVAQPVEIVIKRITTGLIGIGAGISGIVSGMTSASASLIKFLGLDTKLAGFKTALESTAQASGDLAFDLGQKMVEHSETQTDANVTNFVGNFLTALDMKLVEAAPRLQLAGASIKNNLQAGIDQVPITMNLDDIVAAMKTTEGKVVTSATQMAKTINNGLVNGLSNGFAAVGKALVTGENLFAAFGKAVLSSFGQTLIALGTQTMIAGLFMSTVPVLFGFQGAAAVAAGAAMIVGGGALMALAGGGGGGASSGGGIAAGGAGGGGGGVAVGGGEIGTELAANNAQQGTMVNVNIAGNVLDRKESGLEIAKIIEESFSTQGTVIRSNA